MKFIDQEKWIDQAIAQKHRALEKLERVDHFNEQLEGDIAALQAIKLTVNRHRAMRDAVNTVNRMAQAAQLLRETP